MKRLTIEAGLEILGFAFKKEWEEDQKKVLELRNLPPDKRIYLCGHHRVQYKLFPRPAKECYQDYLLFSDHWKLVKKLMLECARLQCECCFIYYKMFENEHEPFEVHHKSYENVGCELEDDIEVLCKNCHQHFAHSLIPYPFGNKTIEEVREKNQEDRDRLRRIIDGTTSEEELKNIKYV